MPRCSTAFILLACAASPAAAQLSGERIVQPPLAGFVTGFEKQGNGSAIVEQVPSGETVHRWTRMVTVQRFAGLNGRPSARGLLENMARGLSGGCPGGKAGAIASVSVDGRPAAQFRADCPRNPATGLPETFIARSIAGKDALHVVQVAFRRAPSAADVSWAQAHLAGAMLCMAADQRAVCRR